MSFSVLVVLVRVIVPNSGSSGGSVADLCYGGPSLYSIGGFRGGQRGHAPKMPKSPFCLAYAVHFCSKTNKIYT